MQPMEFITAHRAHLGFAIRYCISGTIGALLQTLTLFVWVSLWGLRDHYLWGATIGFCLAVAVSFVLQKYWTFRDRTHRTAAPQLALYSMFSLVNLGLNAILLHTSKVFIEGLGFDFFDTWYIVAQITVIGIVAIASFISNRYITFRSAPR